MNHKEETTMTMTIPMATSSAARPKTFGDGCRTVPAESPTRLAADAP